MQYTDKNRRCIYNMDVEDIVTAIGKLSLKEQEDLFRKLFKIHETHSADERTCVEVDGALPHHQQDSLRVSTLKMGCP